MWPDTQVNAFLEKILDAAGSGGGAQLQVLVRLFFLPPFIFCQFGWEVSFRSCRVKKKKKKSPLNAKERNTFDAEALPLLPFASWDPGSAPTRQPHRCNLKRDNAIRLSRRECSFKIKTRRDAWGGGHRGFLYYLVLQYDGTLTCHDWDTLRLLHLVERRKTAAAESSHPVQVTQSELIPSV